MEASEVNDRSTGPLGWYFRAMRFTAGASMLAIVVIMVVQVIARYGFNASLIWAEELCRYILIWQTFILIGYAYHRGELVVLDLFSNRVSPWALIAIRIVTAIPVCIFLYFIIRAGLTHASRFANQTIPAIDFIWTSLTGEPARVPIFWVYVAAPVGCSLLLAHFVGGILLDVYAVATGKPLSDEGSHGRGMQA